jgi:anti-sigma factor RsiW
MTADELLATMPPVTVADRIMVAVNEGRPVDPEDAATLATWAQDAAAVTARLRPVATMGMPS